jgi:hypothetical protein
MPLTTVMATWFGATCSSVWITPLNEQQAP